LDIDWVSVVITKIEHDKFDIKVVAALRGDSGLPRKGRELNWDLIKLCQKRE
jgi:hypothetical protein